MSQELEQVQPVQEPTPAEKAARQAVALEQRIKALEAEIDDLKGTKALLIEEAVVGGVRTMDGYTFLKVAPTKTVTAKTVLKYDLAHDTDHLGEFTKWYRANQAVKVTASAFGEYLASLAVSKDEAVGILAECQEEKATDSTPYQMRRAKKGAVE